MGYEVKLKYYEKVNESYDKENIKELSKKLGSITDEIPLEKLAGFIMMQMARRDILVIDAEIFEYKKSKINFKEVKGGISLKNKKFLFDGSCEDIVIQDFEPNQMSVSTVPPKINLAPSIASHPHNQSRAIDWVVFSPEPPMIPEVKQKGLKFTPDKKYPIYEKKKEITGGEVYVMIDDLGRELIVSEKYFIPAKIELYGDRELGFTQSQKNNDNLYWGSAANDPGMPNIRRK